MACPHASTVSLFESLYDLYVYKLYKCIVSVPHKAKSYKNFSNMQGCYFSFATPPRKITDSKTDEDATRPFWNKYKKYRRRPCRKCPTPPEPPACPYNFTKPLCVDAEPQTPRDLSTDVNGAACWRFQDTKSCCPQPSTSRVYSLGEYSLPSGCWAQEQFLQQRHRLGGLWWRGKRFLSSSWLDVPHQWSQSNAARALQLSTLLGSWRFGWEKSYEIHYVHSTAGVDANPDLTTATVMIWVMDWEVLPMAGTNWTPWLLLRAWSSTLSKALSLSTCWMDGTWWITTTPWFTVAPPRAHLMTMWSAHHTSSPGTWTGNAFKFLLRALMSFAGCWRSSITRRST